MVPGLVLASDGGGWRGYALGGYATGRSDITPSLAG